MLPISNRLFSFTSQSGIHVFQSILSKQPRLIYLFPIYFCVAVVVVVGFFCRSQGQSRRKVESTVYVFFKQQTHASTGDIHFSKEQGGRALWTMWGLCLKGQPRSTRNEFPIRADIGNSRKHPIWRLKCGENSQSKEPF